MIRPCFMLAVPVAAVLAHPAFSDIAEGYDVATPADFGVADYIYKISESDFNNPGAKNNLETAVPFTALFRFYLPDSKETAVTYIDERASELVIE